MALRAFALCAAAVSLAAAGEVVEISFKELEDSATQHFVTFYDSSEKSKKAIKQLEALAAEGTQPVFEFHKVNAEAEVNKKKIKAAGFTDFPQTFSNSIVGGVEPFLKELTIENVKAKLDFDGKDIKKDNVVRFEKPPFNTESKRVFEESKKGPIFVKFYEEWCGHCKKLKKHFQHASNQVAGWTWLEVECSKSDKHGELCKIGGGQGFPHLVTFKDGKMKKYEGGRTFEDLIKHAGGPTVAAASTTTTTVEAPASAPASDEEPPPPEDEPPSITPTGGGVSGNIERPEFDALIAKVDSLKTAIDSKLDDIMNKLEGLTSK